MDDMQLLEELLKKSEMNLTLVISMHDINLNNVTNNIIYILEVDTTSNTAGGRGGGFGSRRFKKVYGFKIDNKQCRKMVESDDTNGIEIHNITRLPIILSKGDEMIASSLIDKDTIALFNNRFLGSYQ